VTIQICGAATVSSLTGVEIECNAKTASSFPRDATEHAQFPTSHLANDSLPDTISSHTEFFEQQTHLWRP
jgi:hypothetical protein